MKLENAYLRSEKFSWNKRLRSFNYALAGLKRLFRTEHNAWLHLAATILAAGLSLILKVTLFEASLLVFAIAFVWMAELFNTAIEKLMDYVSEEQSPRIAAVKDLAAAAVLVAAITAFVIGALVFIPKIIHQ